MPNTKTPSISKEVAIGRRIKGSEMFIGDYLAGWVVIPVTGLREARLACNTRRARRQDLDPCSLGQPVLTIDDHPLTRGKPFSDDGNPVLDRGDTNRAAFDR